MADTGSVNSAMGRVLPVTPTQQQSKPINCGSRFSLAVYPNSFSYPHSPASTTPRMCRDIFRSHSDNKHCNNSFIPIQYRRSKETAIGLTVKASPGIRPSSSSCETNVDTVLPEIVTPMAVPQTSLIRSQSPSQSLKTRVSVLRSKSHVTSRPLNKRFTENTSNRIRHSCDASASASNSNRTTQLTLILMGAPMVGKSAIVNQFLFEMFLRDYRPTVEEFNWIEYGDDGDGGTDRRRYNSSNFSSSSSVDSTESDRSSSGTSAAGSRQSFLLQIIDSAGSRDFLAMRHLYYNIGDAFMIVYSVKDQLSYVEALLMAREIQQRNSKNVPILLVANKTDLEDESTVDNSAKCRPAILATFPVPHNIEFMRISAKNLSQVKQAFNRLIDELAQKREICGGVLQRMQLQKRRQSMPSPRTANELGIDAETLERLLRQHDQTRHSQCIIS